MLVPFAFVNHTCPPTYNLLRDRHIMNKTEGSLNRIGNKTRTLFDDALEL